LFAQLGSRGISSFRWLFLIVVIWSFPFLQPLKKLKLIVTLQIQELLIVHSLRRILFQKRTQNVAISQSFTLAFSSASTSLLSLILFVVQSTIFLHSDIPSIPQFDPHGSDDISLSDWKPSFLSNFHFRFTLREAYWVWKSWQKETGVCLAPQDCKVRPFLLPALLIRLFAVYLRARLRTFQRITHCPTGSERRGLFMAEFVLFGFLLRMLYSFDISEWKSSTLV
jgi:hypothetical protein